jgi:hypothetical protein
MQDQVAQKAMRRRDDKDEEQAAKDWADKQAAFIGGIWLRRYPQGRDWLPAQPRTRNSSQRRAET